MSDLIVRFVPEAYPTDLEPCWTGSQWRQDAIIRPAPSLRRTVQAWRAEVLAALDDTYRTAHDLAEMLDAGHKDVATVLSNLYRAGLIERIGERRAYAYRQRAGR